MGAMMTRLVVVVATLLLVGCYSEFPADSTPQIPVDRSLLGTWWCPSGDHFAQLKVKAKDHFWYEVTGREPGQKTERCVGYASSIGGRTVMNLKPALPASAGWNHPWTFLAVSTSGDVLHRQLVSDGVLTGKEQDSEEVRRALEAALVAGEALEEDAPCRRSREAR
jgi:hypothetical protein